MMIDGVQNVGKITYVYVSQRIRDYVMVVVEHIN